MASYAEIFTIVLILVTGFITYKGFSDLGFLKKYLFEVDPILIGKEYIRLLSSGFLHGGWWHLAFNMLTLYFFGPTVVSAYGGIGAFLLIYFISLLGGNLLALYVHRNHGSYSALGASGAVSGILMAYAIMFPVSKIYLFFVIPIWGWLYGILFILVSIYGIKNKFGNIGHEAHLGGALIGILLALALRPEILSVNAWVVALFLVPIAIFLYLVISRPEFLILPSKFSLKNLNFNLKIPKPQPKRPAGKVRDMTPGPKKRISKEEELNQLLDKVQKDGYPSLTQKEKIRLEKLSKEIDD